MIFGRKKRRDAAVATEDEAPESRAEDVSTTADDATADGATDDEPLEQPGDALAGDETDEVGAGDAGEAEAAESLAAEPVEVEAGSDLDQIDVEELDAREWRTDGPWDSTEVDEDRLSAAEGTRIDLGSLVVTGVDGMELQLQVAEDTQQIVSAMMILGEQVEVDDEVHELNSALEVAAFAAPRSPGFWSEIREEILQNAEESGGSAGLTEGPFGVEVRRMMLLQTPDGEQGYQPSRMWVVEGPRWILRGVVYGHAALDGVPGDHVEHIADLFRQIVVRRGDDPMSPGDLLVLQLPENMEEEATEG